MLFIVVPEVVAELTGIFRFNISFSIGNLAVPAEFQPSISF